MCLRDPFQIRSRRFAEAHAGPGAVPQVQSRLHRPGRCQPDQPTGGRQRTRSSRPSKHSSHSCSPRPHQPFHQGTHPVSAGSRSGHQHQAHPSLSACRRFTHPQPQHGTGRLQRSQAHGTTRRRWLIACRWRPRRTRCSSNHSGPFRIPCSPRSLGCTLSRSTTVWRKLVARRWRPRCTLRRSNDSTPCPVRSSSSRLRCTLSRQTTLWRKRLARRWQPRPSASPCPCTSSSRSTRSGNPGRRRSAGP